MASPCQKMPRLGLFFVLLLASVLVKAQGGGVDVTLADASLLTVKPREVVTRVLQVTNRTGATGTFEGRLLLPKDWRAITPEFPFQLAAGATVMRLVSFFAPENTAAGDYRVSYQIANRANPAGVAGGATLLVRVLPVFKLQVDVLDLPSIAIAGEAYPATFQISNYSNATLTVGYGAESSRGSKIKPAAGTLTLAPGESQPVALEIRPPALTEASRDEISLSARATEQGLSETAKRSVEILPRVSGKEDDYHHLRTLFTRRIGLNYGTRISNSGGGAAQEGDDPKLGGGVQFEWSGSGAVDGSGKRFINFLFRGPDLDEATLFGQSSWFMVDYRGDEFDVGLGNLSFALSPLTEMGAGGIGARLGWHDDQWRVQAWHAREWNSYQGATPDQNGYETALSVSHALSKDWWLEANLLDVFDDDDGHNQVLSLRQKAKLPLDLNLDLEIAGSRGDLGNGAAYWLDLVKMGAPWRLRLNLLYADPNFAGEYQDQTRARLDLGYAPKDQPWSLTAYYHYNLYNQDQKRYLYNYEDRYQYFNQERLVIDPARDEQKAGVGFNWRAEDGSRYLAELRYGECRNTSASLTSFDDVTHSLRLGYAKTFKEQNLSLDTSIEAGFRYDHVTGERVFAQGYRGSLFWRPSKRLTLGAYLNDSIDPCANYDDGDLPTLGLSAGLQIDEKSNLNLDLQAQESGDQSQVIANAQYNYRLDNGNTIGVQAQYASGVNEDANLMLTYTVPFSMPTVRRKDVATVRGQVLDQESGKGLPDVVVRMDRLVAITDARGNFSFPSVKRQIYELTVESGRLPVGMIPAQPLPMEVNLLADDEVPLKLAFIRGATIGGIVQLYEPEASLLPTQTFVQLGQGDQQGQTPKPAKIELKPSRGLSGVLVEVRSGDQVYRRLTNGSGEFRFAGLKPGVWTVKVDPAGLPENATIEETSFTVDAKPSAEETREFKVEQKIRSMRMLAPLKVVG